MNDVQLQKRRAFLINALYVILVLALLIFFFRYAIYAVMPFVIGLVVAMILRPVIHFFTKKCRLKHSFATVFTLVLFYCTIGVLLVFIAFELISTSEDLIRSLPSFYTQNIAPALSRFAASLEETAKTWLPELSVQIDETIADFTRSFGTTVTKLSISLLSYATNFATRIPRILLNTLISIISSFFIALDYNGITRFILRQLSSHTRTLVLRVKNELGSTITKYIKSYSLILVWTFLELVTGLSIIGIPKAPLIALVIAVFDILPVIGSGLFLIPWTIISFIIGNTSQGIGLAILYLVITVMRNIIEPRIVGTQVGLPPIVTLMSMVVGTYLFGGIGLLGLPVSLAIIKSLNDQGFINLYRDVSDKEEEETKPDFLSRIFAKIKEKRASQKDRKDK